MIAQAEHQVLSTWTDKGSTSKTPMITEWLGEGEDKYSQVRHELHKDTHPGLIKRPVESSPLS